MKGVLPWLVRWARRASTRNFYTTLAALACAVTHIFFSLPTVSINVSPIAHQSGQAVVQGRLSLNVFLRTERC
jgi:hypothetical protein